MTAQALLKTEPSSRISTFGVNEFNDLGKDNIEMLRQECLEKAQVLVFKNVFDAQACENLINVCLSGKIPEWKRDVTDEKNETYYRIDDQNNFASKTPHIFAAYNLNSTKNFSPEQLQSVESVFSRLADFQRALSGNDFGLFDESTVRAHPQVIHYPVGGGYFGAHTHPYLPQKVGLILTLSKKKRDYNRGGTQYFYYGQTVDADEFQDQGDVSIFRYDVPHAVSPVDPEKQLQFKQSSGRWVAILPYY